MTPRATTTVVTETPVDELEAFKFKVAAVARTYTRRHGWCDVVNQALAEMGLGGYAPDIFTVEWKSESYYDWNSVGRNEDFASQEQAVARAEELLKNALNSHIRNQGLTELNLDVVDKTPDEVAAQIQEQATALATTLAAIKQPAYPKYRVRKINSNNVESTVWPPPKPRAPRKAPAKKAVPARRAR